MLVKFAHLFTYYITIWHINIRGIASKTDEIQHCLTQLDIPPQVICLQETFLKEDNEVHFHNYALINRNRREKKGGGCSIYIHNSLNFKLLNISDKFEYIKVHIQFEKFETTIIHFYNPPDTTIHDQIFTEFLEQPYKNILILGDFDAHNPIWGSNKTDCNGKSLQDFIEKNDLFLLNDGSPTRY